MPTHTTQRYTVDNLQCITEWSQLLTSHLGNPLRNLNCFLYPSLTFQAILSGFILKNYWNFLEAEFKPKGNKLFSVIELWT